MDIDIYHTICDISRTIYIFAWGYTVFFLSIANCPFDKVNFLWWPIKVFRKSCQLIFCNTHLKMCEIIIFPKVQFSKILKKYEYQTAIQKSKQILKQILNTFIRDSCIYWVPIFQNSTKIVKSGKTFFYSMIRIFFGRWNT